MVVAARGSRVALIALCLGACARSRQVETSGAPRIDVVRPDSVLVPRGAVVEVVIVGRGFTPGRPGGNTIEFAGMTVTNVPANADGTEMRFVVPETVSSGSESPPVQLESGTYNVRVKTLAGTSNAKGLRVFR